MMKKLKVGYLIGLSLLQLILCLKFWVLQRTAAVSYSHLGGASSAIPPPTAFPKWEPSYQTGQSSQRSYLSSFLKRIVFHENFLGGHTHSNFFNIRVFYFENYNYKKYLPPYIFRLRFLRHPFNSLCVSSCFTYDLFCIEYLWAGSHPPPQNPSYTSSSQADRLGSHCLQKQSELPIVLVLSTSGYGSRLCKNQDK